MIDAEKSYQIDDIDSSGLCCFRRCPAKYYFERILGLENPEVDTTAVDYGTAMHVALPLCYEYSYKEAFEKFKDVWLGMGYDNSDDKRNLIRAEATLKEFAETHTPEICPYTLIKSSIASPDHKLIDPNEIPFRIDIGGALPLCGRLDKAVRWKTTKALCALDYKTSSEVSARLFDNFYLSPASIAYTLGLSQLTGERAIGLIVELVRVSKTNAESQMNLIFVKDKMISDFLEFANKTTDEILKANEEKLWVKNLSGCAPYGMFGQPGYFCKYKKLCDCENWQDATKFYVKKTPFHPFNNKESEGNDAV